MSDGATVQKFCFATITSTGYIDQTAGLFLNLKEIYPEVRFVACAIDDAAMQALSKIEEPGFTVVSADAVWGRRYWENIQSRMGRAESAFASKPALIYWLLTNGYDKTLLLDSDLLFLDRVDDVVSAISDRGVFLMAARHGLDDWPKTKRTGAFSAGILGFDKRATQIVRAWRSLCFDHCLIMEQAGFHYEQKYLDFIPANHPVTICHDQGLNLSATYWKNAAPEKNEHGDWTTADGTKVRAFHLSRATSTASELSKKKLAYDQMAAEMLGVSGGIRSVQENAAKPDPRMNFGGFIERCISRVIQLTVNALVFKRVVRNSRGTFFTRFGDAYCRKNDLRGELDRQL